MHRRSFLGRILGGATAVGALGAVTGFAPAPATVCTDGDTGGNADPVGRGRRCAATSGCSDSDTGTYGDPSGNGRRCAAPAACTDGDSGRYGDPVGRGRRC